MLKGVLSVFFFPIVKIESGKRHINLGQFLEILTVLNV